MRVFAEGLLEASDESGASMLSYLGVDQLEALDRSLLRMAGQTRVLVERAKLEAARREAILASMAEGVLAVDEHLRVTFCNQALARLAGTRRVERDAADGAGSRHACCRTRSARWCGRGSRPS